MQRRAAAIYFAFFLVLGAGAYSVIAVAEQPAIELDATAHAQGDTFTVGGQEYTVANISLVVSEGGHGGGGGHLEATVAWTNQSAQFTAELANNSTVPYRDGTYRVLVPNTTDPDRFTLRQEFNVTAILREDPDVYNETVTVDGERHVTYRANNTNVPLDEYLPDPDSEQFSEGDSLDYQGNQTTVENVTTERVLLVWTHPRDRSVKVTQGQNVTLGGTPYVTNFPSEDRVQFSPDHDAYQLAVERQDRFHERTNGLWAIVILSSLAAVFVAGLAYMPVRG